MNDGTTFIVIGLLVLNLLAVVVIGVRVSLLGGDDRKLDSRLTHLEARVENLPTHRDLTALRNDIAEVVGSVEALNGQTANMTEMLRTIHKFLLEKD